MLNSGAGGIFIDRNYQQELGLPTRSLKDPIIVHNVDGTRNKKGVITDYVRIRLNVNDRSRTVIAHVTGLGKQRFILGYPWLRDWNPDVNWELGSLRWRDTEGKSVNNPAEEPSKLKYRDREHEGQETAKNSSRGRLKTFREPAIMALTFQQELVESEKGVSPNETGVDYRETHKGQGLDEEEWIESLISQELDINVLNLEDDLEEALSICAKNTTSMTFAQKYRSEQETADALRPVEEQVPRISEGVFEGSSVTLP